MAKKKRWKPTGRVGTRSQRRPARRNEEERNELVLKNRGLVWSTVAKFRNIADQDREDACQYGMMALMRAAELWDESRTVFSTYAVASIKQWVRRWIRENQLIHVPEDVQQELYRKRVNNEGTHGNERLKAAERASDISELVYVADKTNAARAREIRDIANRIEEASRYLDPVSCDVLTKRFVRGLTLQEIADGMRPKRSRERVRQIEFAALQKLRVILGAPVEPDYRQRKRLKLSKQPHEYPISNGVGVRTMERSVSSGIRVKADVGTG